VPHDKVKTMFFGLDPTNTANVASPGLIKGFGRGDDIFVLTGARLQPTFFDLGAPSGLTLLLLGSNPASYQQLDPTNTEIIPVLRDHEVIAAMCMTGDTSGLFVTPPIEIDYPVVKDFIGLYGWVDVAFAASMIMVLTLQGYYRRISQQERVRQAHEKNDVNYGAFPAGAPTVNWTVQLGL